MKDLSGIHVLVVEDDEDTREMLAAILEEGGASVTTAATAEDALGALERARPDVLLCDIGLPDMDGLGLLRKVRAQAPHGSVVSAIALTGFDDPEARERALNDGFQAYLTKPATMDDVLAAVARVLQ